MPTRTSKTGSELFIVDNSDDEWKVLRYLHDWCQISRTIDIATGYFEVGSLLALKDEWQKVDEIRILMGDEVSKKTKKAFVEGLSRIRERLDSSIETEKTENDFLSGVPAIVEAIRNQKIKCRVYRKDKFHAKTYITHGRLDVIGSFGLVGSSNFTHPGITENIELNVQITGQPVNVLQEWYEDHWDKAEDVTPEILRTFDRHLREFTPFEVYAKALHEFFKGHEMTASEWEISGPSAGGSRMYPILDQYQKEGYHALLRIAQRFGGGFLCDGVGLGKTFVGLMLIERLVLHERKRVALFVPKSARADVWEPALRRYLPHVGGVKGGDFSNLVVFSHTDLGREGDFPYRFERIKEMADVILIDEAHHFRNPGTSGAGEKKPSRYRQMFDLINGPNGMKQVFFLTATPVNNGLDDLRHMLELFAGRETKRRREMDGSEVDVSVAQDNYFAAMLGIHSLRGHFLKMERDLKKWVSTNHSTEPVADTNLVEAEQVLQADTLFRSLVVQRSRAYVRKSQEQQGASVASFPVREAPKVADYSVKKTYGKLLEMVDLAFKKENPLFILGIYYPLGYYKGPRADIDPFSENRQKQVVGLIRTQFLKRFESSAKAFELSCDRLLLKLLIWVTKHSQTKNEKKRLEVWKGRNADLINYVEAHQHEFWDDTSDVDEDIITEEMLEAVEELSRDEYDVSEILSDSFQDLDQIAEFMNELRKFKPQHDDKLKALIKLLKGDKVLRNHKVLIFTEFAETARYLRDQLCEAGIEGVESVDSATKMDRSTIIRRFSPYYNGSSSAELAEKRESEIRILISTDVLSEGLNLQDATRLINYDLHWNPVRLMQRIGRVDRRLNPEIEEMILTDHPDHKDLRGKISYWNFLPPEELEELLSLYTKVSHKTLRISKTFGIEGKKLLRPEDDYEALKDFIHQYEGTTTPVEKMRLEYKGILKEHPVLADELDGFPLKMFSGKEHPASGTRAVYFCFRIPRADHFSMPQGGEFPWTEEAGETRWFLYDLDTEAILDEPDQIVEFLRSEPETPRKCLIEKDTLTEIRRKIEKHIKNTDLKKLQAPVGVKPILKAWMELN